MGKDNRVYHLQGSWIGKTACGRKLNEVAHFRADINLIDCKVCLRLCLRKDKPKNDGK